MKKITAFLLSVLMIVSALPLVSGAATVLSGVVFYDGATHKIITEFNEGASVYADISFVAKSDNATVIAARYDFEGRMHKIEFINNLDVTAGEKVEYTTAVIPAEDSDTIKVFVWNGLESIEPLLKTPGIISKYVPLPSAEVAVLDTDSITDIPLTFAMEFTAAEATEAQLTLYGDWYADFVLTVNKDVKYNADGTGDAYLAGQYDAWKNTWVAVPDKEYTVKANEPVKIMESAAAIYGKQGLKYTYREVYEKVKKFDCGVFFSNEFLVNNPDVKATLELRIYNPVNPEQTYQIGECYEFDSIDAVELPSATVTSLDTDSITDIPLTFAMEFAASEVTKQQLAFYGNWYADFVLTVNKDVKYNADGTGDAYLAGQYDAWKNTWVAVPDKEYTVKANEPVKIMESAAAIYGKQGLKYTYREVYEKVKKFDCGAFFSNEFLVNNPDVKATLELRIYNPVNPEQTYQIGECYEFNIEDFVNAGIKFNALDVEKIFSGSSITLGELFTASDDLNINIDSANVNVTVSPADENSTAGAVFSAEELDWRKGVLSFSGEGDAVITITDNFFCVPTSTIINVEVRKPVVKFEKKFDKDFLYRVGNEGSVSLDKLFAKKDDVELGEVSVTFEAVDGMGTTGVYTANASDWSKGTIDFDGSGIIKVVITDNDYCIPTELYLEVVDAKNITTAIGTITGGNFVLLNDVATSGYVNYWNSTLYGNGFTYDISSAALKYHTFDSKQGHGIIIAKNATFDNLVITGAVYEKYGAYTNQDYYNAAIDAQGQTLIQNCFISHCATPVRSGGSTTIKNSTLYGGTVANMCINGGANVLENVTTVNFNDGRGAIGFGIVVSNDASDNTTITLEKDLKQYNFIKESDREQVKDQYGKIMFDSMFEDKFNGYKFNVGNETYVNTGIISLKDGFSEANIIDNANTGYVGTNTKMQVDLTTTANGYVYTQPNTTGNVSNDYSAENDSHISSSQGTYKPVFSFDLGEQEFVNGDTYISYDKESDKVKAQYKEGDTPLSLDITKLLSMTKYEGIEYNVVGAACIAPDGSALASDNGVVTLKDSGEYILVFEVSDDSFYDKNGNKTGESVTWFYEKKLSLNVKSPDKKKADVNIIKTSLDGVYTTVNLTDYKLRINFLDCIEVKDYQNANSAAEVVDLKSNIKSATLTPANVNVFTTASKIEIVYNDGRELIVELSAISGASTGTPKTATINTSNGVYFITDNALDNKPTDEGNRNKCTITKVSFKGISGETVVNDTDVLVTWELGSSGSTTSCLAEGTMITLADGSKREIENLRKGDKVMSFDHVNGSLTSREVIIVVKTSSDLYYKNTFVFDDGTELAAINEHGIFDVNLKKYVNIDHNNYTEYIGHSFVSVDSEGNISTKKLVDVICEKSSGYKYDIVTDETLNYIAEDTLSVTHVLVDVINSFDFADGLVYDKEKMLADIENYGLYTYNEWKEHCDISVFEQYNIPVMKVGILKGMYTKDYIIDLINTYVLDDSVQILD